MVLGLQSCLMTSVVWGQNDSLPASESTWWKGLFRPKISEQAPPPPPAEPAPAQPEVTAPAALVDTLGTVEIPIVFAPTAATWRLQADGRLEALDSAWRANPPAMKGFRIQLLTGPLTDCRRERSALRNATDLGIYLEPLSANYQVLIGDFRDSWSAEAERELWMDRFPNALVVPCSIELPPLAEPESTIAEPVERSGDWH